MNDIKTELGEEAYLKALKDLLLETIDLHWVRHLNNIELLKKGIYLMGYGQKDPKVEFKFSAYKIYDEMLQNIRSNYLKQIFFLKKI
jgi:preprotein translocase subunit SecA